MTQQANRFQGLAALGCIGALGIASASQGAATGFEYVVTEVDQSGWSSTDPRTLISVSVYITFDDPSDRLIIVNGKPAANMSISTDDASGFFHSANGSSDTSTTRTTAIIGAFPSAQADSYVSIGLLNNDSGTDALITTGMDWATFNAGGALAPLDATEGGGWFITPEDSQGDATDNRVFIGQFTVASGSTVSGTINYMYNNAADGENVEADGQSFSKVAEPDAPEDYDAANDFNGDGKSDILWWGEYGAGGAGVYEGSMISWVNWDGTDQGYDSHFVYDGLDAGATIPEEWFVAGTGDMNSDGRDDIIWRDGDGSVIVWFMDANGHDYTSQWLYSGAIPGWSIPAIGDFNGDGDADILWMGDYGVDGAGDYAGSLITWTDWDGTDFGYSSNFLYNGDATGAPVPEEWIVSGVGDMNGDGRDDLIWRDGDGSVIVWYMEASGHDYTSQWLYSGAIPGWSIRGLGDFNGDGNCDILWMGEYGDDGAGDYAGSLISWVNWDGTDFGYDSSFVYNGYATGAPVPELWFVAGVGDMDGNGRSDVVWRDDDGSVIVWFMDANGHDYTSQWLYSGAIPGWRIDAPTGPHN